MNLTLLLAPITFLFGACIGSFVNVVVMRTLIGEEFVHGRSRCDHCRRTLQWYEMIPLLSFIFLRGRCRTCGARIDLMHPFLELVMGSLFMWWLLIGFAFFQLTSAPLQTLQAVFWLCVGILLVIITVMDLRAFISPDEAVMALSLLVIGYRFVLMTAGAHQAPDFARALLAASLLLAFFLALWYGTAKKGFGFGDVKLVFPLALLMGWPNAFTGVFLAFLFGAVAGIALLALRRAPKDRLLPFGPFLVAGTLVALLWGDSLLRWYMALL
jgi:prepilin signal peptidase PulO-like enzyme (type II secretory pathway)